MPLLELETSFARTTAQTRGHIQASSETAQHLCTHILRTPLSPPSNIIRNGCSFLAYISKLPAYSGVEPFYLQFTMLALLLTVRVVFCSLTFFSFLLTVGVFVYSWKLGGHFGPEKKYLAPPPPKTFLETASWPPPPISWETPPPGIFNNKPTPAPSWRLGLPFPAPEQKKIKNIRNVHQRNVSKKTLTGSKEASPNLLGPAGIARPAHSAVLHASLGLLPPSRRRKTVAPVETDMKPTEKGVLQG